MKNKRWKCELLLFYFCLVLCCLILHVMLIRGANLFLFTGNFFNQSLFAFSTPKLNDKNAFLYRNYVNLSYGEWEMEEHPSSGRFKINEESRDKVAIIMPNNSFLQYKIENVVSGLDTLIIRKKRPIHIAFVGDSIVRNQFENFIQVWFNFCPHQHS